MSSAWALSWGASWGNSWGATVGRALGFEIGGIREVTRKTTLQKVLEAKAERIKPVKKSARKKAVSVEIRAAELLLADGGDAQFRALMDEWLSYEPQLPKPDMDAELAFMAQVAKRIELIRAAQARLAFEQDEEEAILVLML